MTTKSSVLIFCFMCAVLGLAVFLTLPNGGESPTGYKTIDQLTVEQLQEKTNFEFKLLENIPFEADEIEGKLYVTEYGENEVHRATVKYVNTTTDQELYVIASKRMEDLQYEQNLLDAKEVELKDGTIAKYAIIGVGEGLRWTKGGISYGIFNHIQKGQPLLEMELMTKLAEQLL